MIRIHDLDFGYGDGDFRLRIPELTIEPGEQVAFIGPSGSGKTTLLNLIAGVMVPPHGTVRTAGQSMGELPDDARRAFRVRNAGLVFQEFELLDYLNVLDNILLPYRISPALSLNGAVRRSARELAERMDIADKLTRHPDRLSQGERQRVAICRAVLPRPSLLLADEPTGNLDPANTDRVLEILFDYVQGQPATFVTVTHDHELLDRFQRVVDFKAFHDGAGRGVVA